MPDYDRDFEPIKPSPRDDSTTDYKYEMPDNGWILSNVMNMDVNEWSEEADGSIGSAGIEINGKGVAEHNVSKDFFDDQIQMRPVSKGDVVTLTYVHSENAIDIRPYVKLDFIHANSVQA